MNDKVAEPRLRDFMKRYPRRYEPTWMMSKNFYFRAEQLPAEDIAGRSALEKGIEWAEKCLELRPLDANCNVFYGALLARLSTTRGIVRSVLTALGFTLRGVKLSSLANTTDTHLRIPRWEEQATVLGSSTVWPQMPGGCRHSLASVEILTDRFRCTFWPEAPKMTR